jgi:hypothetical protein
MGIIYQSEREAIAASYQVEILDGVECEVEATEGGWQVVTDGDQLVEWAN